MLCLLLSFVILIIFFHVFRKETNGNWFVGLERWPCLPYYWYYAPCYWSASPDTLVAPLYCSAYVVCWRSLARGLCLGCTYLHRWPLVIYALIQPIILYRKLLANCPLKCYCIIPNARQPAQIRSRSGFVSPRMPSTTLGRPCQLCHESPWCSLNLQGCSRSWVP